VTQQAFADRLASRLQSVSISLTLGQIQLLDAYWTLLARWNAKVNLTALPLNDYHSESIDRLIVEPLAGVSLIPPLPLAWADVGSGGGSPAIPMKIARPDARLVMVESRTRKAAFLREVVRSLALDAVEVLNERFEDVAANRPASADCITVRAVRSDGSFARSALGILKPTGRLLLFGNSQFNQDLPGFNLVSTVPTGTGSSTIRVAVPRGTSD
jgi:16S rRNA (guanine527-N7)-methyltransferase